MSSEHLPASTSDHAPLNGLPAAVDVTDTKSLPEWFVSLPLRCQQIVALLSLGFTKQQIARQFGVGVDAIEAMVKRYGAENRVLSLSPANRAELQVAIVQAKAIGIVASITDDDVSAATLRDRAYSAKALAETADRLGSRANAPTVEFTDLDNKLKVRIGK